MSSTEIIEEFQRLPSVEQARVLECLQRTMQSAGTKLQEIGVRYASDEAFDKAADQVLTQHADLFRRLAQ